MCRTEIERTFEHRSDGPCVNPDFLLSAHRGLNEVIVYRYPELAVHARVPFPPLSRFYRHLGRFADPRLGFHHAAILPGASA